MKKFAAYITITIVILQIIAGVIVGMAVNQAEADQIKASNIWMLLNATQWAFAFTVIAMLTTGLYRQLTLVVVMLWVGKLIDELFFDPTIISWNDILNFAIGENVALVLITIHLTKKTMYANHPR